MMKKAYAFLISILLLSSFALAQTDWIRPGTGLGVEKVRLAVPDFKAANADANTPPLVEVCNDTLWNDLDNAGMFDMGSKRLYRLEQPSNPNEMKLPAWENPPANASMVAFGNFGVANCQSAMQGWLFDVKNSAQPQVLGKQYSDTADEAGARKIAHRFADDIIFRLGGGIN